MHLKEADTNDLWFDTDPRNEQRVPPASLRGSIGELKVGQRVYPAKEVYMLQSNDYRPPRDDPSKGLRWMFFDQLPHAIPRSMPLLPFQQAELDRIHAIRRCPLRASRMVLPSGFIRYDLPPGVTPITFTEPVLPYIELHPIDEDDEDLETAP